MPIPIHTETEAIVNRVYEAYVPLPGAAVQIDRPWSFEEMAALDYASTPHWVTNMLTAALAEDEPQEKSYCRYCPNGPNDPCASICRVCGTLCFGEVR